MIYSCKNCSGLFSDVPGVPVAGRACSCGKRQLAPAEKLAEAKRALDWIMIRCKMEPENPCATKVASVAMEALDAIEKS